MSLPDTLLAPHHPLPPLSRLMVSLALTVVLGKAAIARGKGCAACRRTCCAISA